MMVNHMGYNDDYGEILFDSKEPFAKKILECLILKESLDILEITDNPTTVNDICEKLEYHRATIYRRISNLLDTCLLFTVGREKDQKNHGKISSWLYEKSFYAAGIRCGPTTKYCNCQCTIIEILPKRKFYGQILKTVRSCH